MRHGLTIFVTLTVMHAGTPVYATALDDTSIDAAAFGDNHAWADLAQWSWPANVEARAAVRRGIYVGIDHADVCAASACPGTAT